MSYQSITIIGNVGREPNMRYLPNGKAVTNFSVAVNEKVGNNVETNWYKCTAWGKLGESLNLNVTKGRQVFISGRPKLEQWTGQDGTPRAQIAVTIEKFRFLGARTEQTTGAVYDGPRAQEEDDIPF